MLFLYCSTFFWVSTNIWKSNSSKMKDAAVPVTPSKRAAACVSDPFEDACIPKKAKVAEVAVDHNADRGWTGRAFLGGW